MKVIELTENTFDQVVGNNSSMVLVDFGAEWCPPCRAMEPVLENIAFEMSGNVVVGKLDVDSNPQITAKYGVRNLPTFIIFKNGVAIERIVGAQPKNTLVKKLLELTA